MLLKLLGDDFEQLVQTCCRKTVTMKNFTRYIILPSLSQWMGMTTDKIADTRRPKILTEYKNAFKSGLKNLCVVRIVESRVLITYSKGIVQTFWISIEHLNFFQLQLFSTWAVLFPNLQESNTPNNYNKCTFHFVITVRQILNVPLSTRIEA